MTIVLLCPTKGRPEQFRRMVRSAYSTASDPKNIKIMACFSKDDWEKVYLSIAGDLTDKLGIAIDPTVRPEGYPTAQKWNDLAEIAKQHTDARLFMLCADDVIFSTPLWDKALLEHYEALDNKVHVYHLLDNRTGHGTPHPIVTREYIEAMGWFLPPLFLHWFVDTWTVEIAKANNCFTHMTDYHLLHDKPSDKGQPDATHTGIRSMGWHDRDKWVHEHCQHILEIEKGRLFSAMHKGAIMNGRISEGLGA